MGFISNINIKNVFESMTTVRKSKIVQKASPSRLVKVIPTALKKIFHKHVRGIVSNANEEQVVESDHIEPGSIISLVGTGSPVDSNVDLGLAQSLSEELLQHNEFHEDAIMTTTNTAADGLVASNASIETRPSGSDININHLQTLPEGLYYQDGFNQEIQDTGFSTNASLNDKNEETFMPMLAGSFKDDDDQQQAEVNNTDAAEDTFQLPEHFMELVDMSSYLHMDFEKERLVAKCIDSSPNTDEWIPIAEGLHGQNYATRYLPTIIHENKKTLSKFVRAFRDDPANGEIFNSLELAEMAFESLEKHFKKAGLLDCVVEFLKPANHPKRILEELQRARREYQALWAKYFASQSELNALTEKGAATDVQGDPRASITVSELAALESDRDKWQQQFQTASTTLQERLDRLERESKFLEAMKESFTARTDAVNRQYERMWQRQKEQHEFFTEHNQGGHRLAQDITNEMYQELAKEHEQLQSLFCHFPIQLAESVVRETTLKQQLEAEKKISRTSEVEELKKQVKELKSQHETAEFLKTMQEFKHEREVTELKNRLREVEWRQILTPEHLREEALSHALHEAEDLKRLYSDSCLKIMQLRNELDLAQQYGLEAGVIAEQAEKLDEMRLPKTVWSPPAEWNPFFAEPSGAAEPAAESKKDKNSHVEWTDDSEIF